MFIQQFFDDRARLAKTLAADIAEHLRRAIALRGQATIAVSGGSSPLATFNALSDCELDWSAVTVLPTDERWVDEAHDASNAAMIRRELLKGNASAARFVSLFDPSCALDAAPETIGERLAGLATPFDYVLLGMGEDGHTASLFPDAPDIDDALASRASLVVARPPSQPQGRISLTPAAILDSCAIGLLFFSQNKADVFAAASAQGELSEYPVRCVLRQEVVPVTTYYAL